LLLSQPESGVLHSFSAHAPKLREHGIDKQRQRTLIIEMLAARLRRVSEGFWLFQEVTMPGWGEDQHR